MKDFIVLIHIKGTPILELSKETQSKHLEKVGGFIKKMFQGGKMKVADPFEPQGKVINGKKGNLHVEDITATSEKRVGFYRISAQSLEDAVEIMKEDPRLDDTEWSLEIWPILKLDGIN